MLSSDLDDFHYEVADRFGLTATGDPPVEVPTPEALLTYLHTYLHAVRGESMPPAGESPASLKQHAFYRVRATLAEQLRLAPSAIRPDTRLHALLPSRGPRVAWRPIEAVLGIRQLHVLRRPRWLSWPLWLGSGLAWIALVGTLWARFPEVHVALVCLGVATLMGGLAWPLLRVTEPLATVPLQPVLTVGDLAAYCVAYGSPLLAVAPARFTRTHVREVIAALLYLEVGCRRVRWDAPWDEQDRPHAAAS